MPTIGPLVARWVSVRAREVYTAARWNYPGRFIFETFLGFFLQVLETIFGKKCASYVLKYVWKYVGGFCSTFSPENRFGTWVPGLGFGTFGLSDLGSGTWV